MMIYDVRTIWAMKNFNFELSSTLVRCLPILTRMVTLLICPYLSILSDSVRVKVQLFPICAFTAALMRGEGRTARATRLVCIEVPFKCSSPVCF